MKAVMPRYQDRRACVRCGSLVGRLQRELEDGTFANAPVYLPTDRYLGHLDPSDVEVHYEEVTVGRGTTQKEFRRVRFDFYCEKCGGGGGMVLYKSLTKPWVGDLPDEAYYDVDDAPHKVAPIVQKTAERMAGASR